MILKSKYLYTPASLFSVGLYFSDRPTRQKNLHVTRSGMIRARPGHVQINLDLQSNLYWATIGLESFYGRWLVNIGSKSCRKLHLELFALFWTCSYQPTVNSDHCFYSNSVAVNRYDCIFWCWNILDLLPKCCNCNFCKLRLQYYGRTPRIFYFQGK